MEKFFKDTVLNLGNQSKCSSKKVGALLVKDNRIISMGYNGTLPGVKNCCDYHFNDKDHHLWSLNNELHAEQNAILMAAKNGISIQNCTCYSSLQPCNLCLLMLLQAGIKEIVYLHEYDKSNYSKEVMKYIDDNNIILRKFF
jgi:dCMP deaminase